MEPATPAATQAVASPTPLPLGLLARLDEFANSKGYDLVGSCDQDWSTRAAAGERILCWLIVAASGSVITVQVGTPNTDFGFVLSLRAESDGSFTVVSITGPGGV